MLEELKRRVCEANLDLVRRGLVVQTFGNASAVDRERGVVVIKASGVPYDGMKPEHMVMVALATGQVMGGSLRPSSDTATHLELYRSFTGIGGVIHTHSLYATAWAQARRDVPALGTTHADYFEGPVPCTRLLGPEEIRHDYEANTGRVIAELFHRQDPLRRPGVLVASHGPFAWGPTIEKAVDHAEILEYLARLASTSLALVPGLGEMQPELLEKHFSRKHGPAAYYGQHRP
jgi:L-ribulose-5-phosphate 4-epimerase